MQTRIQPVRKPTVAILAAILVSATCATAQTPGDGPFSPDGDVAGSNGVPVDDPNIVEWASGVVSYNPGPDQITDPTGATPTFDNPQLAVGPAMATTLDPYPVVSLGNGGSITLTFAQPIANGPGADFAVYTNKFEVMPNSYFLELATVSVSSDGINFFTFPSVSLTQTTTQVGGFGTLDPTYLYNLAGSEIAGYGTPFNLDDLAGVSPLLNINDITEVRLTDVIGNINTSLGTGTYDYDDASNPIFGGKYGSTNHLINAPYPTPYASSGFSLSGIAVLNVASPEPASAFEIALGLALLGAVLRWRKNARLPAPFHLGTRLAGTGLALFAGAVLVPVQAQTYTASVAYTAADPTQTIYSYDWSGGTLYYGTEDPTSTDFDGLYRYGSSTPVVAGSSAYAGASVVVASNGFIYFNTSDATNEYIQAYNPSTSTAGQVSTSPNFGLYSHNGSLYITGAPGFGTNHIYATALNSDGTFASNPPLDLGADAGSSGPLAFDAEGDLIYAPGYSDQQVLEWSAAAVTAALGGGPGLTLQNASVLFDYSTGTYSGQAGATSMLITGNDLLLSLTDFGGPTDVLSLLLNGNGTVSGDPTLAYSSSDLLGELREHDGTLYFADGANIDQLSPTPEPAPWLLLGAGLVALALRVRVRSGAENLPEAGAANERS